MTFCSRLKLGQQLGLAFGLMVALAAAIATVGWLQIGTIQRHFNGVVDRTLPTLGALTEVQESLQRLRIAELQHLTALTMPEKDREEITVKQAAGAFDAVLGRYFEASAERGDAKLIARLKTAVAAFHKDRIRFLQMSYSAAGAGIERAQETREYFNGEGLRAFLAVYDATRELRAHHVRQADAAKALAAQALASAARLLLGAGAAAMLLSVVLAVFITRRVTGQLGGEPSHVAYIAQRIGDGDLSTPIPAKPEGDRSLMGVMGQMQAALREKINELRDAQNSLVAAARLAGMAEIAANVLHNVGNVLNSVNVSAGLIHSRLRASKLKGLSRAVQLMDEHPDDLGEFIARDPRGKLLPEYLRNLSHELQAEQLDMAQELSALTKSVDHIKEVIATQQSYASSAPFIEMQQIDELVDEALRMNESALIRHKVRVVKETGNLPPLPMDRHRVLQILVNLITNAKHAMNEKGDADAQLALRATLVDGRMLRLVVSDNGVGIAAENLTRIFSHGFTTRKGGHGFGLHSCILAAKEMGGRLSACSAGVGQGSTFTLELPVDTAQTC